MLKLMGKKIFKKMCLSKPMIKVLVYLPLSDELAQEHFNTINMLLNWIIGKKEKKSSYLV